MKLQNSFILIFLLCISLYGNDKVLRIYNWTEYIDTNILKEYSAVFNTKITYSLYESNNELLHTLSKTDSSYDIIFPSYNYIQSLINKDLIQKIDPKRLKNLNNLNKKILSECMIDNKLYCIPYLWGSTGITQTTNGNFQITKWNDLWDKKFKNSLAITEDMADMFLISFKALGIENMPLNEQKIQLGYNKLLQLIPNIKTMGEDQNLELNFQNKDIKAAVTYSGDAFNIVQNIPNAKFIYPKEGVIKWLDCIAITKDSKNVQEIYRFIDYILESTNGKRIASFTGYATPNLKALKLLQNNIKNNRIIYPNENNLHNSTFQTTSDNPIMKKYWKMFQEKLENYETKN